MIVLNVTYKCKPGMRDAFLETIMNEKIDEICRAEDGNSKYDYYLPSRSCVSQATADTEELILIEHWRDEKAVSVHKAKPHFARIGEIKAEFVEETIIERFEI